MPVCSFAVYLRKRKMPKAPYVRRFIDGQVIHLFHFRTVKLWEIPAQTILDLEWEGLLPLLPLTRGGKKPEIVQVMINRLAASGDKELLALAEMYGGLAFTGASEKAQFKRRFAMFQDIMKDSWVYQEIVQESEERGRARGLEEARQTQRQTIMRFVKQRFPTLESLALQQIAHITDLNALNVLLVEIASAQEIEVVRGLLMNAVKS